MHKKLNKARTTGCLESVLDLYTTKFRSIEESIKRGLGQGRGRLEDSTPCDAFGEVGCERLIRRHRLRHDNIQAWGLSCNERGIHKGDPRCVRHVLESLVVDLSVLALSLK